MTADRFRNLTTAFAAVFFSSLFITAATSFPMAA
jgi:hypothetical protein